MLNFIITIHRDGELFTVRADDIPATIRKHLDASIALALNAADDLRPKIVMGLTEEITEKLKKLAALEEWGVDNWEGYDNAMGAGAEEEEELEEEA